ncbi:MAG: hypothetical protein K2P86_03725 [Xanthobacteraceae bacterium]|nr:hypothetical protein [Xanthobacteraceae bacterium]
MELRKLATLDTASERRNDPLQKGIAGLRSKALGRRPFPPPRATSGQFA